MNDWSHGPWRMIANWSQDRFATELHCQSGTECQRCWFSREGTPEDAWPASPPLQQLVQEEGNGSPVMLGVGMAGTSHWSISYSLSPDRETLIMEAACRLTACPDMWIGSRFGLDPRWVWEMQGDLLLGRGPELGQTHESNPVHMPDAGDGRIGLSVRPMEGSRLTVTSEGELWVEPIVAGVEQVKPQTVAWGMRVQFASH